MKFECEEFKKLYDKFSEYSDDIHRIDNELGFATGYINGYFFRLFQEIKADAFKGDISKIKKEDYTAWVGIKDGTERGSKWPAFYTPQQIEEWILTHKNNN